MAAAGSNYRNGAQRSLPRVDSSGRPLSVDQNPKSSLKAKTSRGPGTRKSSPAGLGGGSSKDHSGVPGRVRVAVRLRPSNAEELVADADSGECVELQPEIKRLKLRKNNWDLDTYEFDEVFTDAASQKRVYEVVAKPVIESVLEGYNGTVMAYGQTGTGKTYTLGQLGEEDPAARGIIVRAMEDILADVSLKSDSVCVSYLQLYMETIQDLLDPSSDNISIVEDPKTGDVSLPGASSFEIRDQKSFVGLLRLGEARRFAKNTKLNTESSRSHAILMVHVRRSVKDSVVSSINSSSNSHTSKGIRPPIVRKGKLVVVDLAGSERMDKSGSEGHTIEEAKSINLSLSALGKCINALAENHAHVPVRDSKLTRLLRDSFGGTARTSLLITIGPSPRYRGETTSTIMFGQRVGLIGSGAVIMISYSKNVPTASLFLFLRIFALAWAMKVENMLKLKEEFDYKSLSWRLEIQLDKLIAENERQKKAFEDEIEGINGEAQRQISEVETKYADALEMERLKYQKDFTESIKKLEEQLLSINRQKHGNGEVTPANNDVSSHEVATLKKLLERETSLKRTAEREIRNLQSQLSQSKLLESNGNNEILKLRKVLEDESGQKEILEGEIAVLQSQLLQLSFDTDETKRKLDRGGAINGHHSGLDSLISQVKNKHLSNSVNDEKTPMAKMFEQMGLYKILSLLEAEDTDIRIHAVKVVANLAAEEANQQKIVEAGGLNSLLVLLRSSEDETVHRVAAGAIANLAMNETNQELIIVQGGIRLLSMTAENAKDPQTLRMVAGAIANLCGNDKLQTKLRGEGGVRALLGMVQCGHPDVLAQVARGIANFAKCESSSSAQGMKKGRSLLIEDGVLPWIVQNASNEASQVRRHIELALCHLAQHEANARDMIAGGALWGLVQISHDCSGDDIRTLACQTLTSSPAFGSELRRLKIKY